MKQVLVILFLCLGLNAEQDSIDMKVKRYLNGTVYADIMIKSLRLSTKEAGRRGFKDEFLTRIVAKEDNKTVFDLIGSEYLSKNPSLTFAYKSTGASALNIKVIDNNNHKNHLTKRIEVDSGPIPLTKNKNAGKEEEPYRVNIPAVKETLGDIELINTDNIQLRTSANALYGRAFPVDVYSDIKAKSVTLFAIEENAQMKLICQWQISDHSIIDYSVEINLNTLVVDGSSASILMIIVQGEDGKFYTTKKQVYLSVGGGCSG